MAQRTVALCDGKYIGIETIFTVIDGKQINIPNKLKELRLKSQNNELFCPCGCGANLILVAGDKNLREQHFRIKDGQQLENCTVVTEGKISADSKIVLKCWLDDNLHADDLESRVPICDVTDTHRKYEFSFISRRLGIALDYCHNRANLSDEKQAILEQNSKRIKIIHVVDSMNGGSDGQYPEGLMKIQNKQKYCLLLTAIEAEYETAEMKAIFYGQDLDGVWRENVLADGHLKDYRIDYGGALSFRGTTIEELLEEARLRFQQSNIDEKQRREDERKSREDRIKQQAIEAEKRREDRRIEVEKALEERRLREEEFKRKLETNLEQQDNPVRDAEGNRWVRCEFCGKIATDSEFSSYGGIGHINLGTCKECSANNPAVKVRREEERKVVERKYDPTICPECGGKLKERSGRNGRFIGCSNYPNCRYTRSIKK